ncbi:MAG: trimethylamine methyltransferase family protein, partial [Thermoplasmata archaeon]|nr:trimethylamine methyltransferase family protein [Thermoplasmata archaeon]
MARGRMSLLFPEEIERIHLVSLRMLEKIGIQMRSESVGEMLLSAGAVKSENGNRILIPESMVKSALASVPKSILLASTDGKNDMTIPSKRLYASTGGEGVYLKNLVNGE